MLFESIFCVCFKVLDQLKGRRSRHVLVVMAVIREAAGRLEVAIIKSLSAFIKSKLECREVGLQPRQGWLKFPVQLRKCR